MMSYASLWIIVSVAGTLHITAAARTGPLVLLTKLRER
jgi:hypothetical protein